MSDFEILKTALKIALDAHKEQKDLDGKSEFFHPLEIGLAGRNMEEMVVGFLHDVVEDSNLTFNDLLAYGIPKRYIDTLQLLTHDKSMLYDDYLMNIGKSGNRTAISVKMNDLKHNLARGRLGNHHKQVARHTHGIEIMERYL